MANQSLDQIYMDCLKAIDGLKAKIKRSQQERNSKDPSILSDYLRSEQAYYPAANKERNTNLRFQCTHLLKGHFNKCLKVSWSNNGHLASTGQDNKLIIWSGFDPNPARKLCVIDITDLSGFALDFSSRDGEYVACGGLNNEIDVYRIHYYDKYHSDEKESSVSYTKINTLSKHTGFISDCILLNDSAELMTSSGDAKIYLWDIENSLPTQEFLGHKSDVMCITECNAEYFNQYGDNKSNNKLLLSASTDGTCKIWDYRMNGASNCVSTYHLHQNDVNCCAWFPDGNAFASGSEDGTIKLMDIRTHRQLNVYDTKDHKSKDTRSVQSLCFSKSGYFVMAGLDGKQYCHTWKTATTQPRSPLPHDQRVTSIKLSSMGNKIATGSWDNYVRIWS